MTLGTLAPAPLASRQLRLPRDLCQCSRVQRYSRLFDTPTRALRDFTSPCCQFLIYNYLGPAVCVHRSRPQKDISVGLYSS